MGLVVPLARIEVSLRDDPLCGVALAVYVAGCPRRCPGCQNPDLQDAAKFPPVDLEDIKQKVGKLIRESSGLVDALIFLGGDWMTYPTQYCAMAAWARSTGLRTVLYTGEIYEQLPELVRAVSDWIVDGPWDHTHPGIYPASTNQRIFHKGIEVKPDATPLYKHLHAEKDRVAKEQPNAGTSAGVQS